MSNVTNRIISDVDDGIRIDKWFHQHYPALSHGHLQKMLRKGQVRLDGGRVKANHRVQAGQDVRVPPMPTPDTAPKKKPSHQQKITDADIAFIQSLVIHRDQHVIVINKPAGLVVQGGTGTHRHVDGLLAALVGKNEERPRLVHRIDKDTSGILVLATNTNAARKLTAAFKSKEARKLYWAAVVGVPSPPTGRIDIALSKAPVGDSSRGREQMVPDEDGGKRSITYYETLERAGQQIAWVAFYPVTGRTHQLRVHAMAIGHPIVGDGKYGGEEAFPLIDGLDRQAHLHSRAIQIPHPAGGKLEVSAPLPAHMVKTWRAIGFLEKDHDGIVDWPDM